MAFTAIDTVSRSNAYSGSRQQTEGGDVAFTAIDAVSYSNTYSGSRQQTEGRAKIIKYTILALSIRKIMLPHTIIA